MHTLLFASKKSDAYETIMGQFKEAAKSYKGRTIFVLIDTDVDENDIKEIRDYLRHTRKNMEARELCTRNANDWKQLALVLDRLLFFIYLTVIVVSMTLMFPR